MKVYKTGEQEKSAFPKTISVPFPELKLGLVLKKLGYHDLEKLTVTEQKRLFVNLIFLFLRGYWSQDDLSSVANEMWINKEDKDDELGQALYECAELIFYVRNINYPLNLEFNGQFIPFMNTMMKFYEKYSEEVVLNKNK